MLIELLAQILPSPIGPQDFDRSAVVLCDSPRLEHLVGLEGLVFGAQEEGGGVAGGIVREGDKIPSVLASGDGGWPPDIGVYLVSKVQGCWADSDFGYRLASGTHVYACVALGLLRVGVQIDTDNSPTADKLAGAADRDVAQLPVELHDGHGLDGIG